MTTRRPTSNCLNSSAIGGSGAKIVAARSNRRWPRLETGSGFIISPDGTIVTNNHVIDGASDIKVTLDEGTELKAILVGTIQVGPRSTESQRREAPSHSYWGDSDRLRAGDQILAISSPSASEDGHCRIISARGRDLHSGPYDDFLQVDAPINRGNSGGPLVDINGTVVGINTAIIRPTAAASASDLGVPAHEAQQIVAKLMKNGSFEHGLIGVEIQPVTPDIASALGLPTPQGALVAHVGEDRPLPMRASRPATSSPDCRASDRGTQASVSSRRGSRAGTERAAIRLAQWKDTCLVGGGRRQR